MTSPAPAPAAPEQGRMWRLVRAFVTGPLSPLLLLVSSVAGVAAIALTAREEEPQIVVPMADVLVSFPGASAAEVEQLVATPLERLLWQVDGVEHVYSVSRRDGAAVTVRFFVGEDRERALVRIASRIEAHRDRAPPGVSGWVVRPVELDDVPIVALTLWSPSQDEHALRRVGEELLARLEALPELSRSAVIGGLPREVRVELEPEALAARGLAPLDVAAALRAADAALPAGAFERTDQSTALVAGPFLARSADVGALVIGAFDGAPVRLADVARVLDGPVEADAHVRLSFGPSGRPRAAEPGRSYPAVTLVLAKQKGTNAVRVAARARALAEELVREVAPSDVYLCVTRDYGATADEKVDELLLHLALAIVTVIGLIAWFLGWREGLIVAAAVPVTFALTLLVNLLLGYTINRVTLFALVLVLGLVCDDPIVDVENIHRHFALRKRKPLEAVLFAVNEVRPPVIVATLAVVLSFVPLFFISGMMGPYMRPMALNVPVAMGMSLLVAFTLTPWMSYHLLRSQYGHEAPVAAEGRVLGLYRRLMELLLDRRGARVLLFGGIAALALLAGWLALSGAVPLKMLPYDNKSEFGIVLDLPEGSTLEATDRAVREIERYLATVNEVTDFQSHVGTAGPIDFNGLVRRYDLRRAPHLADVRVNLVPKHERAQRSHEIVLRLRRELERIAGAHGAALKLVELPPGPPVLATLVAEVVGPPERSHAELLQAARRVADELRAYEGVVDVDLMAEDEHARLDFELDQQKAALHGISQREVAESLALALAGRGVASVHEPHERNPLVLRLVLARAARSGALELGRLALRGRDGALVPLSELGRFHEVPEDAPIYHKDLERTVFVLGEVAGRPPAEAVLGMQADLRRAPLPGGITARWSGEGEWQITLDVFRDLGLAFAGALIAIYVLLVVQTGSFALPLLVMLAIPLGAIGILPGFWLLNALTARAVDGWESPVWFTATGMIGMIALAGIVVRNSIILLDFIQKHEAEGAPLRTAVIESGVQRARPIALTAGAAMLGAWPITLDPIFSGLAWSLIFGVLASTVFSLVVVPLLYPLLRRRAHAEAT